MATRISNEKKITFKKSKGEKNEKYDKIYCITQHSSITTTNKSKISKSQEKTKDNHDHESIICNQDKSWGKTNNSSKKQKKINELTILRQKLGDKTNKKAHAKPATNKKNAKLREFIAKMRDNEKEVVKKKHEYFLKEKKRKEFDYLPTKNNSHNKSFSVADSEVEYRIQSLYEWNYKRKEKIEKLKEIKEMEINCLTFQPNERKVATMSQKRTQALIDRLYSEDLKKREANKKTMLKLMTPSFIPQMNFPSKNPGEKLSKKKSLDIKVDYLTMDTELLLRNKVMHNRRKHSCEI